MRILAVDDDEIILEILTETLHAIGEHQIDTAPSGQQAIDMIEAASKPYDCFLLDIQMPGMTGIELCALIQSQLAYRETPIIMITAMSEKRYIDQAFAAGAMDYVTKPFDFLELSTRIKVAEKLANSTRHKVTEARSLDAMARQLIQDQPISLDEILPIPDVDCVLSKMAFENYLLQLNRGQYFRSTVFSVKVGNIGSIHATASAKEFKDIVIDVAEAITDALQGYKHFLTYLGNGIYCNVIEGRFQQSMGDVVFNCENAVYQLGLVHANGSPLDVRFVIGDPVSPGVFTRPGSLSLLEKSVNSINAKATSEPGKVSLVKWA